jgi:hypothetical protein
MADPQGSRIGDCNAAFEAMSVYVYALTSSPVAELHPDSAPAEETPNGPPVPHIDIEQTATGGVKGTTELRTLDWTYRTHSDWLFGTLQGKSRITTLKAIVDETKEEGGEAAKDGRRLDDAEWLAQGWLEETVNGEVVESFADAVKGWQTWQIWGFSDVNGERWLTRRFAARRKDREEFVRARLVYEWVGEREG